MAKKWQVFISYAHEDKATAAALAAALDQAGLSVWIDNQEITLGDSLVAKINDGLKNSQFGVVILSKNFFAKSWTMNELQGLMAKQEFSKTILPVLHDMDHRELVQIAPLFGGLVHSSTSIGLQALSQEIANAVGKAEQVVKNRTVAFDISHRQGQWNGFVPAVRGIVGDKLLEIDNGLAARSDDLRDCKVLILALGWHVEFSRQDITLVRDWVQAGGGLFLLGFYLADSHHETNPSALARALGFSFRNDIVMPHGQTSRRESQDQAFDMNGRFAVSAPKPAGIKHPITARVRELAVLSACSIEPIDLPEYEIRAVPDAAVVDVTGRPSEAGYMLQVHDYVPSSRTEPTILAAWKYGQGRVVAAGTWKLFTLRQSDNLRLVKNAIAWLESPKIAVSAA